MSAKLTAAQERVLREMAKPGAWCNSTWRGGWNLCGKMRTKPTAKLIEMGLLFTAQNERGSMNATITDAGRAYLAQQEQKQ